MDDRYYRAVLKSEFTRRAQKNPRYSLRSFAKSLQIDSAALSRALSNKAPLSVPSAHRLAEILGLDPERQQRFVNSVLEDHLLKRRVGAKKPSTQDYVDIGQEEFAVISNWYHYAILELTFTKNFSSDRAWIGRQLGISEVTAKLAVERLLNLGLLAEDAEGKLTKTSVNITTKDKHRTTGALRDLQRQILEKAIESLESDPLTERCMMSTTFAIDAKKMPLARELIVQTMRFLGGELESGDDRTVYHLGISLYPVEHRERGT